VTTQGNYNAADCKLHGHCRENLISQTVIC